MSEDEKDKMIAQAVRDLMQAKKDVAFLKDRVRQVFYAYRELGDRLNPNGQMPMPGVWTKGKKLDLEWSRGRFAGSDVLGEADLVALLDDEEAAKDRLEKIRATLLGYGITL